MFYFTKDVLIDLITSFSIAATYLIARGVELEPSLGADDRVRGSRGRAQKNVLCQGRRTWVKAGLQDVTFNLPLPP